MDKKTRLKVGITYGYFPGWIGGSYYRSNLLKSLDRLEDSRKPEFLVISNAKDFDILKEETKYPYLKLYDTNIYPKWPLWAKVLNNLSRPILGKNIIDKRLSNKDIDAIFISPFGWEYERVSNRIYWLYDFQEAHLPQFFTEEKRKGRVDFKQKVAKSDYNVVLSSEDAKKDYLSLHQEINAKTYVLPFAVVHPNLKKLDFEKVKAKYSLPDQYFFCANQFWPHKNHITILKALKRLNSQGIKAHVVFSGREKEEVIREIKQYASDQLETDQTIFLGFIDREDQLLIMKHAQAVIQPSLFEGWSTVVEDSKSLNKYIIASNLNVHKEQLSKNVSFFEPLSVESLAECIQNNIENRPQIQLVDYNHILKVYADRFLDMIEDCIK